MIYLFDKHKKLKGTVRARHTIALLYERERNGIYSVSAEIPVSLTDKRTVYNYHKKVKGSDFIGHYDREGRFQLHKIAAVDVENTSIFIKGIHLFFDEAKAGAIIRERRFRGSEITDGAREAFDPIGWSVVDFDTSVQKNYSFYNVSPLEARAILVETFGYEFDYWLDFDGKNLRNKQIAVKRKIGKETNKRYNYGHNVLSIKVEQDYSEIYTAVIGRGKGEDLDDSDGYGRRIEFTDVEWKKPSKPLDKPKGSRTLIDPTATQLFGYHDGTTVSPRTKVEVFSDIEDESELLQASYEWLMENNVPKAVFSLNVPDGDGLDLGDSVHVIYRDIDLIKSTRVTKVIDDLVSGNRSVEFGDTAYFETDRRISGLKADLKRVGGSTSSRIARLKAEFDRRFDEEVQQWKDDFEQALIDAEADVETMRAEMTEEFEAAQKAFEDEFNQSVADAKKYANEQAEAKAEQVQDNLDSFAGRHEQLVGELQGNIVDIDGEIADARADVSEIVGRLTGMDGSISGITESLSDVEGTLTNTKTQLENQISDARTELEQSISNTRTELEGRIDTTEEALGKVGEDLGNAKTELQNQLDDARKSLDELEIGGRNLLIMNDLNLNRHSNTEVDIENGLISGFGSYYFIFENVNMKPDTFYTFSYVSSVSNRLSFLIRNKETGELQYIWNAGILPPDEKVTFKVPENVLSETDNYHVWVYISGSENIEWQVEKIQLEKGTVATDWTPAPEDMDNKITNINQSITNIEGELSTKVEQTEVDTLKGTVTQQGTILTQTADEVSSKAEKSVVDTLTGRVANTESSVTQNAEEIAKRLTKSVYDSDKKATDAKITQWSNTATETAEGLTRVIGRVSETEKGVDTAQTRIEAEAGRIDGVLSRTSKVEGQVQDAQLAIEANADGLALRATKTEVEQAIDGIEVGGRNLMKNSKIIEHRNHNSHLTFIPSQIGMYTISFDYNIIEENSKITRFLLYSAASGVGSFSGVRPRTSTTQKRVSQTFEVTDNMVGIGIYLYAGSSAAVSRDNKMDFIEIMVEKGTVATDWTPAPEDIDASLSEVTDRVTTAEAELVVQAGEISQKATQSELDRVTGRVSTAETSITQNADEIARRLVKSDYDSDKAKIDGDITKWSNLTTETAEGLEQTISRVSTEEGKVSKAQADISANTKEIALKASQSELNSVTGRVSTAESQLSVQAGQIALRATKTELEGVEGRVSATESALTVMDDEISSVVGRVSGNETNISSVVQDVSSITSTVATLEGDVATQGSKIEQTEDVISSKVWMDDIQNINPNLIPFADTSDKDNLNYWTGYGNVTNKHINDAGQFNVNSSGTGSHIGIQSSEFELVQGRTYTFSVIVQTSEDWNTQNWFNYTYLMRKSGNNTHLGSATRSEPITETIMLKQWTFTATRTEDVYILLATPRRDSSKSAGFGFREPKLEEGTERTLFMNAFSNIEQKANELSLKVAELSTNLDGENVLTQSDVTVSADRVVIGSKSIGSIDFASILAVSPRAIDIITDELNLTGNLNVKGQIESISMSAVNAEFANLLAHNANIERLVAQQVFINEVKALSITAVEANIGSIRSKILTTNVVQSSHIASGTALIDKIFSSTAMFERMMAKSGFVRTLNTVTIDTDQLTIRRPDGVAWVSRGQARGHVPVFMEEMLTPNTVSWSGQNYLTTSNSWQRIKFFYSPHEGSMLRIVWAVSFSGASASEIIEVRVNGFGNYNPINMSIGQSNRSQLVVGNNTEYITQDVPMPPPNYKTMQGYLEFRRSPDGAGHTNQVRARILHIGQYN